MKKNLFMAFVAFATIAFVGCEKKTEPTPTPTATPVPTHTVTYSYTGEVPEGAPVVYNSSDGVLGVGLNKEDFARTYEVGIGENWLVTIRKEGT